MLHILAGCLFLLSSVRYVYLSSASQGPACVWSQCTIVNAFVAVCWCYRDEDVKTVSMSVLPFMSSFDICILLSLQSASDL